MNLEQIEYKPSNYYDYRKTALLWAQKLSGQVWTDFNPHDPGLTMLEALCYVLTELDYKLDFSIEDILHSSEKGMKFKLNDNALFLAEEIFQTAPVTTSDFRILIIDKIEAISNAWLKVHDSSKGSFNLIVQLKIWAKTEEVKEEIQSLFNQQKSIGWSLNKVSFIEKKEVTLNGDFHFSSDHSAEKLFASLIYSFNEELVNEVPPIHSLETLQKEGKSLEEIYSGPKLDNGIILSEDLKPFYKYINLQQVKGDLMKLEGLVRVNDFSILVDEQIFDQQINVDRYFPFIDPSQKHNVRIFKENKSIEINEQEVAYQYHKLLQINGRQYDLITEEQASYKISEKTRDRRIAEFYTLLQEFPSIYQYTKRDSNEKFKVDNEQFKKFILPFEQMIANSMKQLSELSAFFSIHSPEIDYKYNHLSQSIAKLQSTKVDSLSHKKERNDVLNHLLARFDYEMDVDLPDLYYGNHPDSLTQRIKCKELLLELLPVISRSKTSLNTKYRDELSYLQLEILLRLWIDDPVKAPLSQAISDLGIRYLKLDDEGSIRVKDYLDELYQRELTEKERRFYLTTDHPLEALLLSGTERSNYSVRRIKGEKNYGLFLTLGDTDIPNLIHKSRNKKALIKSINHWIKRFYEINKQSEGFYLFDCSKFRKEELKQWHSVVFVFASWSKRFQSKSFQQNVEKIITSVMPAHLSIQFAWLDYEEMKEFESGINERTFRQDVDIELGDDATELLLSKLKPKGGQQ